MEKLAGNTEAGGHRTEISAVGTVNMPAQTTSLQHELLAESRSYTERGDFLKKRKMKMHQFFLVHIYLAVSIPEAPTRDIPRSAIHPRAA